MEGLPVEVLSIISSFLTIREVERWSETNVFLFLTMRRHHVFLRRVRKFSERYEWVLMYQLKRSRYIVWNGKKWTLPEEITSHFQTWYHYLDASIETSLKHGQETDEINRNISSSSCLGEWISFVSCFPLRLKVMYRMPSYIPSYIPSYMPSYMPSYH